ncbi:HAD-IA family hydrolase [Shewanella holmiensis]|jgi:putative hydrolase of the HAD superfamily|uniref:HAD-IA family hydrolase n=1 Tax=Shewanella holmiensis TaxID=2952222 RepID=A0A9X2WPR6_9GAMM|nr:HAD-IA family hydrolase [Shewanella holmiensis]MCT7943079.1 HAD-IA family hydrolase [Shewanella holmiensis]
MMEHHGLKHQPATTSNASSPITAYPQSGIIQYQRLKPFKAISFDLDDTLYDNQPIIANAVKQSFALLHRDYPASAQWTTKDWLQCKLAQQALHPELKHDTSAARYTMLREGLLQLGYNETQATQGAQAGLACFQHYRSDFKVAEDVIAILQTLKTRFTLVGITNGNVDASRIGLSQVLEFVLHPGYGVKMKPHSDMFTLACKQLAILPSELLHIGDHPHSDIVGAKMVGCQTVWLNPCQQNRDKKPSSLLPQITIMHLSKLLDFCH